MEGLPAWSGGRHATPRRHPPHQGGISIAPGSLPRPHPPSTLRYRKGVEPSPPPPPPTPAAASPAPPSPTPQTTSSQCSTTPERPTRWCQSMPPCPTATDPPTPLGGRAATGRAGQGRAGQGRVGWGGTSLSAVAAAAAAAAAAAGPGSRAHGRQPEVHMWRWERRHEAQPWSQAGQAAGPPVPPARPPPPSSTSSSSSSPHLRQHPQHLHGPDRCDHQLLSTLFTQPHTAV